MAWGLFWYGIVRLFLWSAAVFLALFPTISNLDTILDRYFLWQINQNGHFRDLFFLLAPASALALATILDFIWDDNTSKAARIAAIVALLANLAVLLSGFVGFLRVPDDTVLPDGDFATDWKLIVAGLIITLVSELWISVASERRRTLLDRNWNDIERVRERIRALQDGRRR